MTRTSLERMRNDPRDGKPGLLIVQIDGLSLPALEGFMRAGRMPVMARLVRSRQLTVSPWIALLPPVTPASQAGILHGSNDGIPAFRWYEKSTGRLMIANHAEDATEIVRRISNGHGLLAPSGASIGNLASGDAAISHLTMATIEGDPSGNDRSGRASGFPRNPLGYLWMNLLIAAEFVKEGYQSWRQQVNDVRPRMHRGIRYAIERAVTNVPLRIVSTALVKREIRRGCPVIYVDYTGYDEIAHHSGPERPEAQAAAELIDRSIGHLLEAARDARRRYRLVVLSDHGQTLGSTFRQLYGERLEDVVIRLMGEGATAHARTSAEQDHDSIGRLFLHSAKLLGLGKAAVWLRRRFPPGRGANSPVGRALDDHGSPMSVPADAEHVDVVVCASGNLAHIYFTADPGRMTREQIDARYPGLVDTLAKHAGFGLIMVRSADGLLALGRRGRRNLDTGAVDGADPLQPFGEYAGMSLRRLSGIDHCGDVVAIGRFDPELREVVSFEELVGSHGGLGGWQSQPFLAHPRDWRLPEPPIGAPAVNQALRGWMADLGLDLSNDVSIAPDRRPDELTREQGPAREQRETTVVGRG